VRFRDFSLVREELDFFLEHKVPQVKFVDRTFNCNKKHAMEIWRHIAEHDNGVTNFHFEICGEILDEKLFSLLAQAREGLFQFEIGIQSANGKTLEAVDRRDNVDAIFDHVERLIDMGNIHIHVDLIAGLPYEDYRSFAASFNQVYALGADNLQLGFLKLLKGTKIRGEVDQHEFVYRDAAPYEVISTKYLSAIDLIKLKMIENVLDLFSNKGGFELSMTYLEAALASSAFNYYEQLADFFYSRGYQHKSYKKEDLYRILLKFAESREMECPGVSERAMVLLCQDLEETMNAETVKRFYKKGWDI
jgi:radical SAM superfamily enzyme YgiQ (UPF0313 family)